MTLPSVTVVLPVLNGLSFLRRSLPPLVAAVGTDIDEVLMVDDGCTDGSPGYAEALGARVLTTAGRTGPAAARNAGVRACAADVVFFVDADVVIHDDAIRRIRERLADPRWVAVFGSYDDRPTDGGFFSRWKNLQHHFMHQGAGGEASTFWTGCGAVRRDAFLAVGGFDVERFPHPSIEDIELGYRLRARGGAIALDPLIRATHLKRWALGDLLRTDVLRRALPWARLLQSRPEAQADLNVKPSERARAALAGVLAASSVTLLTPLAPLAAPGVALLAGLALLANARLVVVFWRRHGLLFAGGGALFLQVYYLYATGAWIVAWAEARGAPARGPGRDTPVGTRPSL